MELHGLVVPVPTLFADDGALDTGRNARFARALSEEKVDHLFVLGSLGEFPSLTAEERPRLLESVIESVSGPTDVWVGVGAPSTAQARGFADEAEGAGAAAVVAVPPYYLRPTEEAIARYYRAVRAEVSVPLLAYNIPSLVGYSLRPELVHRLGAEGVLAGVKDTSGSIESVARFLDGRPEGFVVMPGDDPLAAAAIARGASGAVMGLANIVPKLCAELVRHARAGEEAPTAEAGRLVEEFAAVVRSGPFPSTVKFLAARLRGADVGYRAPYEALSPDEEARVAERLAAVEPRLAPYLKR